MGRSSSQEAVASRSVLVEIPAEKLVLAEWNYKQRGKPEEIEKLAASIKQDASAGVLPVRELPDGTYEVIDGNHRKESIDFLGWKTVKCENFGKISKAEAIIIARRRNYQWFRDDLTKLGELYRDEVLPHLSADMLDEIMPEGVKGMEALIRGLSFDWEDLPRKEGGLTFGFTPSRKRLWDKWVSICETKVDVHDRGQQFDRALLTAIKTFEPDVEMDAFEAADDAEQEE